MKPGPKRQILTVQARPEPVIQSSKPEKLGLVPALYGGTETLVTKRHLVILAEDLSSSLSDCVEMKPIVVEANFCPFPTSLVLEDHSASQMN